MRADLCKSTNDRAGKPAPRSAVRPALAIPLVQTR